MPKRSHLLTKVKQQGKQVRCFRFPFTSLFKKNISSSVTLNTWNPITNKGRETTRWTLEQCASNCFKNTVTVVTFSSTKITFLEILLCIKVRHAGEHTRSLNCLLFGSEAFQMIKNGSYDYEAQLTYPAVVYGSEHLNNCLP